jgi:hypothetical protein
MELLVNGYAILPGHAHASGRVYEWVPGLSILELSLAEVPDWAIALTREARSKTSSPGRSKAKPSGNAGRRSLSSSLLDQFNADETARRLLARHGIVYEESAPFLCFLPGHREETPSANIWRTPEGALVYRDFHRRDGRGSYRLADVFAATVTGTVRVLGRGEQVVWGIRMLADMGLLGLPEFPVFPPDRLTPGHRKVWDGLVLLARCRAAYGDLGPFPLGWEFAALWCGVSKATAARAIKGLWASCHLRATKRPQTQRLLFRFGTAAGAGRVPRFVMSMRRRQARPWQGVLFAIEEDDWDNEGGIARSRQRHLPTKGY